jgi:hypothetical protein
MLTDLRFGWAVIARAISISVAALIVVLALSGPAGAHDHWTKLKGVPASIADGLDNVGSAGFGLELTRGNSFFVNTSEIQRRVTSSCVNGQAIKHINSTGTVTCSTGPQAYTKRIGNTGEICNGFCTEGSLTLSPGTWAITAKITVLQGQNEPLEVLCQLVAGGLSDDSETFMSSEHHETVTLPMQLVATLSDKVNTSVQCKDYDVGSVHGSNLSIMAIRVSD